MNGRREEGKVEERRKNLVSEPAPREMICFFVRGRAERKCEIRVSMARVRIYVPVS